MSTTPRTRYTALWLFLVLLPCSGCGTTKGRTATEQLLTSHAVDTSIGRIPFEDLAGRTVYFDTQYIVNVKGMGFVNSYYIISSFREKMITSGCLLQDKKEDAEIVVEARIGALATQSHEVTYGIPASSGLSSAASLMPAFPAVPAIPEISLAKRNNQLAAAKVGVFAYNRKTKQPVWQSGISQATSTSNEYYVFGAGPFQRGSIYKGTQFAGSKLKLPLPTRHHEQIANDAPPEEFSRAPEDAAPSPAVQNAGFQTPVEPLPASPDAASPDTAPAAKPTSE